MIVNQQQHQSNNVGLTGFIFSLITIFLFWVPVLGWLFWLTGLICSIIGLFKNPKAFAIAGTAISGLGLIIMLCMVAFAASIFSSIM